MLHATGMRPAQLSRAQRRVTENRLMAKKAMKKTRTKRSADGRSSSKLGGKSSGNSGGKPGGKPAGGMKASKAASTTLMSMMRSRKVSAPPRDTEADTAKATKRQGKSDRSAAARHENLLAGMANKRIKGHASAAQRAAQAKRDVKQAGS
jgi:flagellar biosynthesis GTPase FlhF